MHAWQGELLSRMQATTSEESLFDAVKSEAQQLGFSYCAYGMRLSLNVTQPKTVILNNYPIGWQQLYLARNYVAVDPVVRHASNSAVPIAWSDDVFNEGQGQDSQEFWEEAHSHGLRYGWSQSSMDMQGIRGMLTLARGCEPVHHSELRENGYRMMWLTQVVHQCMSRLVSARMFPTAVTQLSSREKDVLRWTAEGKTSGEIADILHITERTVNFHVVNAMQKLNCVNKTAATVRAALLGLLN